MNVEIGAYYRINKVVYAATQTGELDWVLIAGTQWEPWVNNGQRSEPMVQVDWLNNARRFMETIPILTYPEIERAMK